MHLIRISSLVTVMTGVRSFPLGPSLWRFLAHPKTQVDDPEAW
jgi:hypothetical protein